jgi:hypothetical protein
MVNTTTLETMSTRTTTVDTRKDLREMRRLAFGLLSTGSCVAGGSVTVITSVSVASGGRSSFCSVSTSTVEFVGVTVVPHCGQNAELMAIGFPHDTQNFSLDG